MFRKQPRCIVSSPVRATWTRTWRWAPLGCLLLAACGGPDRTVRSPQERIDEQERLAYEDEKRARENKGTEPEIQVEEEKKVFDQEQMERELVRATRSAETCTGVVETKHYGETEVTLVFEEAGTVKEARLQDPYADTPLGSCILRAYEAIIIPPYQGGDQTRTWKLELKKPELTKPEKKTQK